ncbi:MAG TPA: hypothetical protein VF658_19295 [Pyrinomonadaceae bacterium]|jgi:hypothetical protein
MDFAYAPGETSVDDLMRDMLERRSDTIPVPARPDANLREFIADMNNIPIIPPLTRLADNILLCTHAYNEGVLDASMFPGQSGETVFETLEETLKDPNKSIAIPDPLIGHNPNDPITHFFHIKGCNVGTAVPFMVKLKEALGNHVNVTAPIHFHGILRAFAVGVFEYMAYKFQIVRRDPFKDRAEALAAFISRTDFKLIDGTVVPEKLWKQWIPKDITKTDSRKVYLNLGRTIGKQKNISADRDFQVVDAHTVYGKFTYTIPFRQPTVVPTQTADQEKALAQSVNANPKFQATHPFPIHTRFGYASIADFLAGYNWTFSINVRPPPSDLSDLVCSGQRCQYIMMVPITNPVTGNIIFNFHPNKGSGLPSIRTGLVESDTKFFATV